jgi:hypothetical protein
MVYTGPTIEETAGARGILIGLAEMFERAVQGERSLSPERTAQLLRLALRDLEAARSDADSRVESVEGVRPWDELKTSGLLWLINRVVFHPRGFAVALVRRAGVIVGWRLLGDGREVWEFTDEDDLFAAAQATLTPRETTTCPE